MSEKRSSSVYIEREKRWRKIQDLNNKIQTRTTCFRPLPGIDTLTKDIEHMATLLDFIVAELYALRTDGKAEG